MSLPTVPSFVANPYRGYVYGYPHKTSYRPLTPTVRLADAWKGEATEALFGYLHLPFCEMRCGFCNLFTTANPKDELVEAYLAALEREITALRDAVPSVRAARLAIGGGTPTYLEPAALQRVLTLLNKAFDANLREIPTSVETSPATATPERLTVLAENGVRRVSIGVQAFDDTEVHRVGRPQKHTQVRQALDDIRAYGPAALNIDLIYGLEGQSEKTWLASLSTALSWQPEEIFCYPLYVRQLTGLGKHPRKWDDQRLRLYRLGRDYLRANGYRQTSMRRFERIGQSEGWNEPEYACQSDAMVGLGCGARSYTRALHYSREYAVARSPVRAIIDRYCATTDFSTVEYGFELDADEQQRRFLLLSLLHVSGVNLTDFHDRFGIEATEAFPQLRGLACNGLTTTKAATLSLTDEGLELSDAIGPWLFSDDVRARSGEFQWR